MALGRSVNAIVERQVRNWELAQRQQPRSAAVLPETAVHGFVTISRSMGSGGADVARALANEVGWPLFDRELLKFMSGDDEIRERLYHTMDERDLSFMEESLRSFLGEFNRNDYFHRLTETILAIARKEKTVFLGRAADLILPADTGLRVRIAAPRRHRIERYAQRMKFTLEQAEEEIDRTERDRRDFIRNHFEVDVDAVERFDLCLNMAALSVDDGVKIIARAMELRGLLS